MYELDKRLNALIERGAGAKQEHNEIAVHEITVQVAELITYAYREYGLVLRTESDGYMHFTPTKMEER